MIKPDYHCNFKHDFTCLLTIYYPPKPHYERSANAHVWHPILILYFWSIKDLLRSNQHDHLNINYWAIQVDIKGVIASQVIDRLLWHELLSNTSGSEDCLQQSLTFYLSILQKLENVESTLGTDGMSFSLLFRNSSSPSTNRCNRDPVTNSLLTK